VKDVSAKTLKTRRSWAVLFVAIGLLIAGAVSEMVQQQRSSEQPAVLSTQQTETGLLARDVLETLEVKGRAPKTGYARDEFGSGWASVDGCDMRNIMLARAMTEVRLGSDACTVLSGVLDDPYTGAEIQFVRGSGTSGEVQIDHVVALSDAWQKGAQDLEFTERVIFANDPLNLLAVDGPANQEKGDADAASWLPPNRAFRCRYVARQIAVKAEYKLWVTEAEKAAMRRVLNGCGDQRVPNEN
jgi:hypothetical protein